MTDCCLPFFAVLPCSCVCPKACHSGHKQISGNHCSIPSSSRKRTALGHMALFTPSTRRWPVHKSAQPCRPFTRCTMQKTPLATLRRPPPPLPPLAWTLSPAIWTRSTPTRRPLHLHPAGLAATTHRGTPSTCQRLCVWSPPCRSCMLADVSCLSCTGPSLQPLRPRCRWRAMFTTSCMRCRCLHRGGRSSSTAYMSPLFAKGQG